MSMRVEFLVEQADVVREWPQLAPLFEKVVSRAVHGEFTTEDLYRMATEGRIRVGLVREGGEIILAMAFEFKHYPRALAINFLAMGGRGLQAVLSRFLGTFKQWARDAGAMWIEASCSPAMARIYARHDFLTTYQLLRLDLQPKGETT